MSMRTTMLQRSRLYSFLSVLSRLLLAALAVAQVPALAATVSITGPNISVSCQYTAQSSTPDPTGANYSFTVSSCTGLSTTTTTPATVSGFSNISTRARVDTGANVMIAGFAITGTQPRQVLVLARGPSLAAAPFNIPNTLADPTLRIVSSATNTELATNDNFGTAPNLAAIQATGLAPTDPKESAILITLTPGLYTAIVEGANSGTGVAIVEVFDRQLPSGALSLDTAATAASISTGTGTTTIAVARTGGTDGIVTGTLSITGGCVFTATNTATAPVTFGAGSSTTQNFILGAGAAAAGTSCAVSLASDVLGQPSSVNVSVVQSAPSSSCTTTATRNFAWAGSRTKITLQRGETVAMELDTAQYPLTNNATAYGLAVNESVESAVISNQFGSVDMQIAVSPCPGDFAVARFTGTCLIHTTYVGGPVNAQLGGASRTGNCILPEGTTKLYVNVRQIKLPSPTPPEGAGDLSCPTGQACPVWFNVNR